MLKKICALLSRKPTETKLPDFPVEVPTKKELVKKATTRKPAAKKTATKKVAAKKTATKNKK